MILTHRPSETRCEDIAVELATQCGFADQRISWFISDTLPPVGFPVHENDQLEAYHRDHPGSVFMTVLMENDTDL